MTSQLSHDRFRFVPGSNLRCICFATSRALRPTWSLRSLGVRVTLPEPCGFDHFLVNLQKTQVLVCLRCPHGVVQSGFTSGLQSPMGESCWTTTWVRSSGNLSFAKNPGASVSLVGPIKSWQLQRKTQAARLLTFPSRARSVSFTSGEHVPFVGKTVFSARQGGA